MRAIERYILRRILAGFAFGLAVLTAIIWATQALQRLDVVTSKGQTIGLFLVLTGLAVPYLATLMAPIALLIAMIAVYDQLNRDSELAVLSGAGASRLTLAKPALFAALVVSAAMAVSGLYLAPLGLKEVRVLITEVRADLISSIVQPGHFIEVEDGLVFHIRDRRQDGSLAGLVLSDQRNSEAGLTYLAETGTIVERPDRTLLVMTNGSLQRHDTGDDEMSLGEFEAYAFDLTHLIPDDIAAVFKPSERTVFELLDPPEDDGYVAEHRDKFRIELHERFAQPLYPFAFVLVAFLFVGDPRSNRQSRLTSILSAALAVAVVRFLGYGATTLALGSPAATVAIYAVPVTAAAAALAVIASDRQVRFHERAGAALAAGLAGLMDRFVPHRAPAAG